MMTEAESDELIVSILIKISHSTSFSMK